ncbi:flagellar hook-length control protein FliK [Novosphingopyxis sp. YJ-S2-01]|nr:flagellar hook-length control protein FliK [Novosphingopyxis sp. YJ-S2-01]
MLDSKASERPVQPVLKSSSLGENGLPHRTVHSAQALETPQPAAVFQVPPPAQNGPQQAAANAPTIFTAPAPVPFDAQFGQRVSAAIGAAMNAMTVQDGTLMLQISPDRLGRIEIAIDRASERLHITTENESVRGAIAQAHSRIEQELRAAGQRIGTIDVATRDPSTGTGQGQSQNQAQAGTDQQRGQQNAAQQSFGRMGIDGRRAAPEIDTSSRPNGRPSSNILYA